MAVQKSYPPALSEVYRGRRFWFLVPVFIYAGIMVANSSFLRRDSSAFGEEMLFWYASIFLVISAVAYCGVYYKKVWPVIFWLVMILLQGVIILWNYYEEISLALLQPERNLPVLSKEHIILSAAATLLYISFLFVICNYVLKPGWKSMKQRRNWQATDSDLIDSQNLK